MPRLPLLAVLLAAPAALAEVPPLSFSLGYASQVFGARGYDLVDVDDHLSMARVAVGTGVGLPFGALDLELAYLGGGTDAVAHGALATSLALRGVQLAATLRLPVRTWFQPYAQLGGGLDWATLTLGSTARLTQTALTGSGQGLLGVQFHVRLGRASSRRAPWLVFDLGGGGVLRSAANFEALRPQAGTPDVADALGTTSVDVGSLPLSGWTFRFLLGLRF